MAEVKRLFHTLDMLRGIAAIAVLGRHLGQQLTVFLPSSHLAVDLFFVLSGFVITHAYDKKLRDDLGTGSFIKLRLIRLYPLYLLGTILGLALTGAQLLMNPDHTSAVTLAVSVIAGLLFLPVPRELSVNHFHMFPFNYPAWSLFWELVINFVYVLIARHLGGGMLRVIIALGAVMLAFGAWHYGDLTGGSSYTSFALGGLRVVYSFFMGIAVYRVWLSGRYPFIRVSPLLAAAILLAIMAVRLDDAAALYDFTIVLAVFPVLVLASTREPEAWLRPACTTLGVLSYPVYALHAPLIKVEQAVQARLAGSSAVISLALELAFVAGMLVTAWLADRWFDRPVRRWLSLS